MSNDFFIPFNFEPAATVQATSTYTVPAGKYAIAKISMVTSVYLNDESGLATTGNSVSFSGESNNSTHDFVLSAGDIMTKAETPANKTVTVGAAAAEGETAFATSLASVDIDNGSGATTVAAIRSVGSLYYGSSAAVVETIDIDGTAEVYWHIQEYNIIS